MGDHTKIPFSSTLPIFYDTERSLKTKQEKNQFSNVKLLVSVLNSHDLGLIIIRPSMRENTKID